MALSLTPEQLNAITIIERVGSVFSLLGCLFIIVTFSVSKAFHKPINRLVFYASFGNMMTNVGTLLAREYVGDINTFGCQFQGFLIQMFLPADALWTLAMAVNVYLTFYFKFDAQRLRRMEIWYLLLCYGVPFIPALTFIFVSTAEKGRMYGNATLWCWVSQEWDIFRIATFYGPVWVVIVLTFFIYLRAGREIYNKRKQLHYFSSNVEPEPLTMDDPFSVKTTEVMVTTEINNEQQGIDLDNLEPDGSGAGSSQAAAAYSVTISSTSRPDRRSFNDYAVPAPANITIQPPPTRHGPIRHKRRANFEANNAAWSYTKCAILFFTAILITWLPSSANRVYSVINGAEVSAPLEFMSALVLPLQGFWNAVIYVTTSWSACKYFFSELLHSSSSSSRSKSELPSQFTGEYNDKRHTGFKKIPARGHHNKQYDSESMTELAQSTRPSSNDVNDEMKH